MTDADAFLASLGEAARAAGSREEAFKAEAAASLKQLEAERTTAYRRLSFLQALTARAAAAETPEAGRAAVEAHVRATFGWDGDSEARTQVFERLAPLSAALFTATHPATEGEEKPAAPPEEPAAALAAFEDWYEQTRTSSFWYLFEHYMPETPRVDF
ncbi:hypothetical protein GCM10007301_53480 [Azorhizobium oxalatiphilum]|uniref:Uncharacterized protein n=1 Tax=Azorhizobium oxalatiphilum TaxID=980631 RepID=A0A917CFI7_9HYPH|nr:hypothetical protein [Azorhizobium oxalatiphilum]GGF86884.1 hypothetical protein GCM10007301_53480 [Azorhizobium oxalatiphilum]